MEIDNKIHKQLDSNGIIILKNAITHDELNKLCTKYESGWKEIINKWNTLQQMKIKFNTLAFLGLSLPKVFFQGMYKPAC